MELPLLQLVFLVLLVALPISFKEGGAQPRAVSPRYGGGWGHFGGSLEPPSRRGDPSPSADSLPAGVGYVPIGITQVVLVAGL
jgi:hypothetical protein